MGGRTHIPDVGIPSACLFGKREVVGRQEVECHVPSSAVANVGGRAEAAGRTMMMMMMMETGLPTEG